MTKRLNERQKKFCEYYILNCNAADAARKAGYQKKSAASYGYRLLQQPAVQEYLEQLLAEAADQRVAEATEILVFYTRLLRGDFNGNEEVKFSDRLKAAEALAKMFGLFSERFGGGKKMAVTIVDDVR